MPLPTDAATGSKKRKNAKEGGVPSSKRRAVAETRSDGDMVKIQELEDQISESRKYYNNIVTLISMLNADGNEGRPNLAVAVSLCRVFSRLMALGNLTETSRAAENEKIIVAWLKERCREYQKALVSILRKADPSSQVCHAGFPTFSWHFLIAWQVTALTLCMLIINERATHLPGDDTQVWLSGLFKNVFEAVVEAKDGQVLRSEFLDQFAKVYEDVRYYTFVQVSYVPDSSF